MQSIGNLLPFENFVTYAVPRSAFFEVNAERTRDAIITIINSRVEEGREITPQEFKAKNVTHLGQHELSVLDQNIKTVFYNIIFDVLSDIQTKKALLHNSPHRRQSLLETTK